MAKHFIVTDKSGAKRLVEAQNKAAALQHVIGSEFTCEVATTSDVIDMMSQGINAERVEEPEKRTRRKRGEAGNADGSAAGTDPGEAGTDNSGEDAGFFDAEGGGDE